MVYDLSIVLYLKQIKQNKTNMQCAEHCSELIQTRTQNQSIYEKSNKYMKTPMYMRRRSALLLPAHHSFSVRGRNLVGDYIMHSDIVTKDGASVQRYDRYFMIVPGIQYTVFYK